MFQVKDRTITSVEPFVYLAITENETYTLGEALKMGKKATKCGTKEKPTHICMGAGNGKTVPAMPVLDATRFEVPYEAMPAIGEAVTLSEDAMRVTAVTGGAFVVTGVSKITETATGYFK